MKNDELVIMGIYPHESQDLVSVVVLSNDGHIQIRSVIQYKGLEAVNFLDDCKINSKTDFTSSIIAYGSEIEDNKTLKKHQFLLGERSHLKF